MKHSRQLVHFFWFHKWITQIMFNILSALLNMNTKRITFAIVLCWVCWFAVYTNSMHIVSMQKPQFPRFDIKNLKLFGLEYKPQSADGFRKDLVIGYREYYVNHWTRPSYQNNCGLSNSNIYLCYCCSSEILIRLKWNGYKYFLNC